MRQFHIDFTGTENTLPDGNILGKQGEHNATELIITPPAEMTENENITSYRIAFELTNCRAVHSEIIAKTDVISFSLFSQITSSDTVAVQLEGYDNNGELVIKSEKISKLKFNPSVCGVETAPNTSSSMAAEVTANTNFRKEFGEDETGNLTYKGLPVSGDNYKTAILYSGEFGLNSSDYGTEILDYMNLFPVGAIIKTIRVEYAGKMIDIKNLTAIDSVPYILHMGQVYLSPITSFPVLAFIGNYTTVSSGNYLIAQSFIISAIENYKVPKIEIDYYE